MDYFHEGFTFVDKFISFHTKSNEGLSNSDIKFSFLRLYDHVVTLTYRANIIEISPVEYNVLA